MIIVGAGLAGMGAGQALKLRGVPAIVLEVRDRIGGRCFCDNSFPAPFDFGGQFFQQVVPNALGGTNNPLFNMYRAGWARCPVCPAAHLLRERPGAAG